jgi:hypothetical protein
VSSRFITYLLRKDSETHRLLYRVKTLFILDLDSMSFPIEEGLGLDEETIGKPRSYFHVLFFYTIRWNRT